MISDLYYHDHCNKLVDTHTDRFMRCFSLNYSEQDHIIIADKLFATYREFYQLSPDDVTEHMRDTYQFHVDTLSDSMNNRNGQRDGTDNADGLSNQLVLNEVVQPQQDPPTVRTNRRDAVRNAAAPDNPDDDDDNQGNNPGCNGGGGCGNGGKDDNGDDDNGGSTRNPCNGNRDGDGDPPPPGSGNVAKEKDELEGVYMTRDIRLPLGIKENDFIYTHERRKLQRAFYLFQIADLYHSKLFAFGGIDSFVKLSMIDDKAWKALQNRALKWQPRVTLNSFQVKNLTAISLWVLVKVVYGDYVDVDSLAHDDVDRIVAAEKCDPTEPVGAEAPKLQQCNQYLLNEKPLSECEH